MLDSLRTRPLATLALEWQSFSFLLASLALWVIGRWFYNIYFHPLARYPGPKLAAMSYWWQVYVEVIKKQSLSLKLQELHLVYGKHRHPDIPLQWSDSHESEGDVVRIGPNDVRLQGVRALRTIRSD